MLVLHKDLVVTDHAPSKLKGSDRTNKKDCLFYRILIQVASKKLQRTYLLKNKLRLAGLKSDYRLLKESCFIITIAGTSVATKNDQNNKELDIILGNKSNGSNVPTKILLEKSIFGKSNKPKNKPINMDIIALLSLKFF